MTNVKLKIKLWLCWTQWNAPLTNLIYTAILRFQGENLPFIYINCTDKLLSERPVLYTTCVLLPFIVMQKALLLSELCLLRASKLLFQVFFFSCHLMACCSSTPIPPKFVFHKTSLSSLTLPLQVLLFYTILKRYIIWIPLSGMTLRPIKTPNGNVYWL